MRSGRRTSGTRSRRTLPLTHLYSGAAGTVWALYALGEHAEVRFDLGAAARGGLTAWRAAPDFVEPPHLPDLPPERHASLWMGESGPLLMAWLTEPAPELAEAPPTPR